MRHGVSRLTLAACLAFITQPTLAHAQSTPSDSVRQALQTLFDAMHSADTARTRAAFLDGARVIPIAPQSPDAVIGGLTVDAFVTFVAKTTGNPWIETMKSVEIRVSGGVASAWFDYEVRRGSTFSHCGVNAVTLRRAGPTWRIITMAFTNAGTSC